MFYLACHLQSTGSVFAYLPSLEFFLLHCFLLFPLSAHLFFKHLQSLFDFMFPDLDPTFSINGCPTLWLSSLFASLLDLHYFNDHPSPVLCGLLFLCMCLCILCFSMHVSSLDSSHFIPSLSDPFLSPAVTYHHVLTFKMRSSQLCSYERRPRLPAS